jgi:hypothetical protein
MKDGFETALTAERDRLNLLLERVKAGETWIGETPDRSTVPSYIAQIKAAIDQIEFALSMPPDARRA